MSIIMIQRKTRSLLGAGLLVPGLLVSSLLVSGLACSSAVAPPPALKKELEKSSRSKSLSEMVQAGRYQDALRKSELEIREGRPEALLWQQRILFLTGKYDEVSARKGVDKGGELLMLRARAHQRRGRLEEALALLPETLGKTDSPDEFDQVLLRAEIRFEQGRGADGTKLCERILARANEASPAFSSPTTGTRLWSVVGRCAHLLRSPKEANEAYNKAEELGPAHLELLLFRVELFLEKFDALHAQETLDEAKELSPHHPEVLLLEAKVALEQSHDFVHAEELAKKVLSFHPGSAQAHGVLAAVRLRDFELAEAAREIAAGQKENPRDQTLLAYQASERFLAEDRAGFAELVEENLRQNPESTQVLRVVSDFAEWEHRYPDIEKLMRRAVRLDREDGRPRAILGLTLVRSASDAAGVVELRRAAELDPFNIRVKNTLALYQGPIIDDYVEIRHGPFELRLPRAEQELLLRYVPALLDQAYAEMKERYRFTPQGPIGIEIYESREQFAVRTSGLPRTGIHGVCFGRKLATMSPVASPGNLGMTLWHELAHVFHMGLSDNRVPRYLTEGLAEWETAQRGVGWAREMDSNLLRALRNDSLPKLGSMNRAFTHARVADDIATAYYASSKIAEWMMDEYGQVRTVRLLSELGQHRLPNAVLPDVLGASAEDLDAQFRTATEKRLKDWKDYYISPVERLSLSELQALHKENPKDRSLSARLVRAHLVHGNPKAASALLDSVDQEPFHLELEMARVDLLVHRRSTEDAIQVLLRVLDHGHEGPELRGKLSRLLLSAGRDQEALPHLLIAQTLDPKSVETVSLLASVYLKSGQREKELQAVKKWAELSEHDPLPHRRLMTLLLESGDSAGAKKAAELAIWVDLAGMETHRLAGLSFSRSGDLRRAEFEFESALLCPSELPDRQKLEETWREELLSRGLKARAEAVRRRFASLPIESPLAPGAIVR